MKFANKRIGWIYNLFLDWIAITTRVKQQQNKTLQNKSKSLVQLICFCWVHFSVLIFDLGNTLPGAGVICSWKHLLCFVYFIGQLMSMYWKKIWKSVSKVKELDREVNAYLFSLWRDYIYLNMHMWWTWYTIFIISWMWETHSIYIATFHVFSTRDTNVFIVMVLLYSTRTWNARIKQKVACKKSR